MAELGVADLVVMFTELVMAVKVTELVAGAHGGHAFNA